MRLAAARLLTLVTVAPALAHSEPLTLPAGVVFTGGLLSESAWAAAGGDGKAREAGQAFVGATVDAEQVFGLRGGTLQATVSYRWGEDLGGPDALHTLQGVQEIYGRGQTWRLTQLWYRQDLGDHADLKLGRLTVGEDFASFRCTFQNLTFCGAQPGNLVSDYWHNWPVSQWGARVKLKRASGYVQGGVYEVNPRNLEKDFTLGRLDGATGAMIPVELARTPSLHGRPGRYTFGGWYDTSDAADVHLDEAGRPRRLSGRPGARVDGRGGAYLMIEQQLTGDVTEGRTASGITVFLNVTQADRRTARIDRQIALGAFYLGPFSSRPHDELGVALGATHPNSRLRGPAGDDGRTEYVAELFYRVQVTRQISLQPSLQYIANPGGAAERNAAILGLKASAILNP